MSTTLHSFMDIFETTIEDGDTSVQLNKIVIPLIQRDYAQGRIDKDINRVRNRFLQALYRAVTGVSCWSWCRKSELSCERIKRKQAELRFPSATMSFSRRSGSAGLVFQHKAPPIWRKPHLLCLQRTISGSIRFVQ